MACLIPPGSFPRSATGSPQGSANNMLKVTPVRAFTDNYIWLIHSPRDAARVVAVDPGDAKPVERMLADRELALAGMLMTHHHGDHVGGVTELLQNRRFRSTDRPARPFPAIPNDCVKAIAPSSGAGSGIQVLDVPGHTAGHIAYVGHGARVLRRHAVQRRLRPPVRGHGGTNAHFAVQTGGAACRNFGVLRPRVHLEQFEIRPGGGARQFGGRGVPVPNAWNYGRRDEATIPSDIRQERNVNPFLRCDDETVKQAAEAMRAAGYRDNLKYSP